jgi:hypothetical protein
MIRGTTAQFKFQLPYSMGQLQWITIHFWQPGNPSKDLPICKNKAHCNESNPQEICVSLTAEETKRFTDRYKAKVQLRAQPIAVLGGPVFGSKPQLITVYPMPDDLIDEDTPLEPPGGPVTEEITSIDGGTIID